MFFGFRTSSHAHIHCWLHCSPLTLASVTAGIFRVVGLLSCSGFTIWGTVVPFHYRFPNVSDVEDIVIVLYSGIWFHQSDKHFLTFQRNSLSPSSGWKNKFHKNKAVRDELSSCFFPCWTYSWTLEKETIYLFKISLTVLPFIRSKYLCEIEEIWKKILQWNYKKSFVHNYTASK